VGAVFLGAVLAGAHGLITTIRARLSRVLRVPATFGQGLNPAGLWVLTAGRVALNYCRSGESDGVTLRTRSVPGAVVAWAGWGGITHS